MADRELRAKRRQRDGIIKDCESEMTNAIKLLEQPDQRIPLETSLRLLKLSLGELKPLNEFLLENVPTDEFDQEADRAETAVRNVNKTIVTLQLAVERLDRVEQVASASSVPGSSVSPADVVSSNSKVTVRLPKLDIEKFDGDPLKFQEFWDHFSSTIHGNSQLSTIDKFKYLKSYLAGDALKVADGYALVEANYQTIVDALKTRFGNRRLAIFIHFTKMLNMEPLKNNDTQKLQALSDEFECHVRSLVSLDLDESTFEQVFAPILLNKLPPYVQMELHRKLGEDVWSLDKQRAVLRDEIRLRQMSYWNFRESSGQGHNSQAKAGIGEPKKPNQGKHQFNGKVSGKSTASMLPSSSVRKQTVKCTFCGQQHASEACQKFPDAKSRRRKAFGKCFNCLRDNHMRDACKDPRRCKQCKEPHHTSLCDKLFPSEPEGRSNQGSRTSNQSVAVTASVPVHTSALLANSASRCTNLQTAIAGILDPSHRIQTKGRLLFDTGGSRTYITKGLAQRLCLQPIRREILAVAGFSEKFRKTQAYDVVEFDILLNNGCVQRVEACTTDIITSPVEKQPLDLTEYPLVATLHLAEPLVNAPTMLQVDILIGNDFYYRFVENQSIQFWDGMVLISSKLGYLTAGTSEASQPNQPQQLCALLITQQFHHGDGPNFDIERFWSLEDIGIKDTIFDESDEAAFKTFSDNISRAPDGRYQVVWPWKDPSTDIPDNYHLARGRFSSLIKRIGHDKDILEKYDKTIREQMEKNIVEVAPNEPTGPRTHYIPHHCVVTPGKKTTKLRIVYDASAKCAKHQPSLNELLHRGPVLLSDLCGMLMRFRLKPVVMVSDIEKAFLQVELKPDDRDVTRFFWLRDVEKGNSPGNVVIMRFCRVPFGVISSPFMLSGTIRYHLSQHDSPLSKEIEDNRYVDNIIIRCNNAKEASQAYAEAKQIFQDAKMNLREWYTNSQSVLQHIAQEDKCADQATKILGLLWDVSKDVLSCSQLKIHNGPNTKRTVLQTIASLFDPCGMLSPISIRGKCLMQNLWKQKCDWDDPLPPDLEAEWAKIQDDLHTLHDISIPRFIGLGSHPVSFTDCQLHCFADASGKAYSAVIYLRFHQKGKIICRQLFAKSRVAPAQGQTIPRLELMGVLIGTRCLTYVKTETRLTKAQMFLWTDSTCVLGWLKKATAKSTFVVNRVKEIKQHTDITFRYVPSASNPADVATRGSNAQKLGTMSLWWYGPTWLIEEPCKWPEIPTFPVQTSDCINEEIVETPVPAGTTQLPVVTTTDWFAQWIAKFSSLTRLRRTIAWIYRFVKNCRGAKIADKNLGPLTASEIDQAALRLDRIAQSQRYPGMFSGKLNKTEQCLKKQLNLFLATDGVIRMHTRFGLLDLPDDACSPKLLPAKCHYAELVLKHFHAKAMHFGASHTLGLLRQEYWLPTGRLQAKRICNTCKLCRKLKGGAYKAPPFAPLPAERGTPSRAFATTGVDYLGPLIVKDPCQGDKKVWICLFTCAIVRAIHLEVALDLTAAQFLLALRRFCALRSCPQLIISDNAKNFRSGQTFLAKAFKEIEGYSEVQDFAANQGISWRFVTERAPWMGGFYERLIGVVKKALVASIHRSKLSLSELQTLVAELAAVVNSRPLLYVGSDDHDNLTPAHFLLQHKPLLPHAQVEFTEDDYNANKQHDHLILTWKRIQACQQRFWSTWRSQYLPSLLGQKYRFQERNTAHKQPEVGDVVHIGGDSPRLSWPLGVVVQIAYSADDMARSAYVKTNGNKTLKRPIRLLYPLEVEAMDPANLGGKTSLLPPYDRSEPSVAPATRSRRRAAIAGEQLRQGNMHDESDSDEF